MHYNITKFIVIHCWQRLQWLQYCSLLLQYCNAFYNIVIGIVGGLVLRCRSTTCARNGHHLCLGAWIWIDHYFWNQKVSDCKKRDLHWLGEICLENTFYVICNPSSNPSTTCFWTTWSLHPSTTCFWRSKMSNSINV